MTPPSSSARQPSQSRRWVWPASQSPGSGKPRPFPATAPEPRSWIHERGSLFARYDGPVAIFDPDYTAPEGLPALVRGLLTVAHERHMDLIALVQGLPSGGLKWTPGPGSAH